MRIASELNIYNSAFELSLEIERDLRRNHPHPDAAAQLRRSINSVADNLAEGCAFDSDKVMRRHCFIALGSLMEAHTQVLRMIALEDLDQSASQFVSKFDRLRRQLIAFIRHLDEKIAR